MDTKLWTVAFFILLSLFIAALVHIRLLKGNLRNAGTEKDRLFRRTSGFLLVLGENLKIHDVSWSILRKFHLKTEDLLGQYIDKTVLWPDTEKGRNDSLNAFRKALSGIPSVFSYDLTDAEGRGFSLEIKAFPIPSASGGKQDIFCVGRDMTTETGTKQMLTRRVMVEDIIARISTSALTAVRVKECVPGILESAGEFLDARRAFFFQTDRNSSIIWESIWNAEETPQLEEYWRSLKMESIKQFMIEPGFISIRNLQGNESLPESFRKLAAITGTGSLIITSLEDADGTIFGYAGFSFNRSKPPEDESSSLLFRLLSTTLTGLLSKIDAQRDMELFRQLVDVAGQGVVLMDVDGQMTYANRAYYELTGREADSSEPVWNVYADSFSDKVRLLILPLVRTGERWTGELRIIKSDNTGIDTVETFYPIVTGTDEPRFIVNVITDISDRKRLEGQLIAAKKEADHANRAKSDYLANMSHEIRTPMNAVIGLTYLALQTDLDNRQRDYLMKVNTAAKNLLVIINDILDLSKIELGHLELETVQFSLDEVLDNLADMIADKARGKGLKLLFSRAPEIQDSRTGDRFRLGQVLLNLVGNAIKFTPEGMVVLRIEAGNPGFLTFFVEDTGIGMTEEQVSRLFSPFRQAEASTSRKYGGTGLGLTISKHIVELMGGSIRVESEHGKGSRFIFTARMDSIPEETVPKLPEGGKTAFIVSGDSVTGEFHRQALHSLGMKVTYCPGIKEALENPVEPSVLLLDTDAFDDNPAKVAFVLSDGTRDDFVLILSGSQDSAELSRMAPDGVTSISLPLPYSVSRLKSALSNPSAIGSGEKAEDKKGKKKRPGSLLLRGRVLLVDDNDINQQVGKELIERAGLEVDIATSGAEAVNACESRLYDMVLMDLHMPEMSGYEAASLIRQHHPDLPAIAMTASALIDVRSNIKKAGFSGYIAKPIEPDELYRIISEVLAVPVSALRPTYHIDSDNDKLNIAGVDTGIGLRQVLGDRVSYRKILRRFAAGYRSFSSEIRMAMETDDIAEAISLFHTLRGAAGHVGAVGLQEVTGRIEELLRKDGRPDDEELTEMYASIDTLVDNIESSVSSGDSINRAELLNELEDLIRKSDEAAIDFLESYFGKFTGNTDQSHMVKIRSALMGWDYDSALDAVDDWRIVTGGLME